MILERLEDILENRFGKHIALTPETNLIMDLELNSLDMVELIVQVEECFDIEIPDREIRKLTLAKDLADLIERKLDISYKF